jgi:uncharacterized protein (TIGR04222 family)
VNPFDLRGPDFLCFYLLLGAVALVAARLLNRRSKVGEPELLTDPYQLAYLRGGPAECVRVALFSLLDRRILKAVNGRIRPLAKGDGEKVSQPLERALVGAFAREAPVSTAFRDPGVEAALTQMSATLQARGLVPGAEELARSRRARVWLVLMLLGVAGTKLVVALARGRTNVLFLVILAVVLPLLVWLAGKPPSVTRQGKATLDLARGHFQRLRNEAGSLTPGRSTPELTLYAGLFGMVGLSPLTLALAEEAQIKRGSAGGSSGCGGGGCGGGGCGGGGCGGCG